MNLKHFISAAAIISLLSFKGIAYCDSEPSYEDTIDFIAKTMASSTSDYRKESYGHIRFDDCVLDYDVSGTYPVGSLYDINFKYIDFTSLNYRASKTGHDYTAFITLDFDDPFQSRSDFKEIAMHTAVINVSDDEKAHVLFEAFLHLGELCGAPGKGVGRPESPGTVAPGK